MGEQIKVTRVVELTYASEEVYLMDRVHWNLPDEGQGVFGPTKAWKQTITVQKTGLTAEPKHD